MMIFIKLFVLNHFNHFTWTVLIRRPLRKTWTIWQMKTSSNILTINYTCSDVPRWCAHIMPTLLGCLTWVKEDRSCLVFLDYATALHNTTTSVLYILGNSILSRNCTNRSLLGYGERTCVTGSCLPAPLLGKPLTPDQTSDILLQQGSCTTLPHSWKLGILLLTGASMRSLFHPGLKIVCCQSYMVMFWVTLK